jgi:hypothetical protein
MLRLAVQPWQEAGRSKRYQNVKIFLGNGHGGVANHDAIDELGRAEGQQHSI